MSADTSKLPGLKKAWSEPSVVRIVARSAEAMINAGPDVSAKTS